MELESPESPESPESQVPDEADFAPAPPKPPGPLALLPTRESMLLPLAFYSVCAAVSFVTWQNPGVYDFAVSGKQLFSDGEWWRLVSALFAHKNIYHLAANGVTLLLFGWFLRHYFGAWVFPGLALLCGIASNLATVALYSPEQSLLGASGMDFALVAMWLILYMRFDTVRTVPRRLVNATGFAMVMILPTEYAPNVSYLAHLTGFGAGIAAALLFWPFFRVRSPRTSSVQTDSNLQSG